MVGMAPSDVRPARRLLVVPDEHPIAKLRVERVVRRSRTVADPGLHSQVRSDARRSSCTAADSTLSSSITAARTLLPRPPLHERFDAALSQLGVEVVGPLRLHQKWLSEVDWASTDGSSGPCEQSQQRPCGRALDRSCRPAVSVVVEFRGWI